MSDSVNFRIEVLGREPDDTSEESYAVEVDYFGHEGSDIFLEAIPLYGGLKPVCVELTPDEALKIAQALIEAAEAAEADS